MSTPRRIPSQKLENLKQKKYTFKRANQNWNLYVRQIPKVHVQASRKPPVPIVISYYKQSKPITVNRATEKRAPFWKRKNKPVRGTAICRWFRKRKALKDLQREHEKERRLLKWDPVLREQKEQEYNYFQELYKQQEEKRQHEKELQIIDEAVKSTTEKPKVHKAKKEKSEKQTFYKSRKEKKPKRGLIYVEKEKKDTDFIYIPEKDRYYKPKKEKVYKPKKEKVYKREEEIIYTPEEEINYKPKKEKVHKYKKEKIVKPKKEKVAKQKKQIVTSSEYETTYRSKSASYKPRAATKYASVKTYNRHVTLNERFVNCFYRFCCQLYCCFTILFIIGAIVILVV